MEKPKTTYELRKSLITNIIQMTNLSYGDKKKKSRDINTLTSLYHFLLSDEAIAMINPVLRIGILDVFESEFSLSDVFDDLNLGNPKFVEYRKMLVCAVEKSEQIKATLTS